ncbi:MAG: Lipopolysaccharide export system permease protein LptG [Candidatus Accumulibacter appositus]|uniref:Lipopolysaccharide export system permease protein LptG n=1 Tax=Candidatus Accumulibacter appositus TaxID=1454003 RepID=A0A011N5N0_9PROT|nr:LPS export ABC transporter permease LptG [Accumulibacter sp.]EXI77893.1 MAG: Lipopolysaccharide export system permease protein LptG [Candidatus Accumulibacter appositus]HRF03715.1 LPS export ABC transporter permease LptG [Accumulibacter sp.]
MKIYRRYLLREVSGAIVLVLLAFLALFAFFDMLGEVQDIGRGGYQLRHAFAFVLLRLPGRVYELMPIAVLIGTLYALSSLARHSEITVLRVSGLSSGAVLRVLFLVAAMFAVATFLIGEYVAPTAEREANQLRLKARGRMIGQDLRSGLWVKDERSFINVRVVLPDTRLRGVRIYEFDEDARLRSLTEASEGEYVVPDSWRLSNVVQTVLHAERADVQKLPEIVWQSALNPDILAVLMVSPDRMSLQHLATYTKHLADNRQTTNRYEIAFWKKVVYPLAAFVMVALALPFGGAHYRSDAVGLKVFSGVMIGILFHMLNGLFANLGAINSWSPVLSAVTPSSLFLLAAITMIWWVERR